MPLLAAAAIIMAAVAAGSPLVRLGPLAGHMAEHIVLMNIAAPALALLLGHRGSVLPGASCRLAAATAVQLALLWAWHAPAALAAAHASPFLHMLMQASLLGSALWFWLAVIAQAGNERWRSIAALLVTGKLFCFLGVLLTFAPRLLLGAHEHGQSATGIERMPLVDRLLPDQQMAGLMMLAACPATYVLAAIVIMARWLDDQAARASTPTVR